MKRSAMLGVLTPFVLGLGCVGPMAAANFSGDPTYAQRAPEPPPLASADGAIRVTGASLYSGRRAFSPGDHLTIKIIHRTAADSSADTKLERENSTSLGISALLGLEGPVTKLGLTPSALVSATGSNDFEGKGGTNRSGSLSAVLTARVIDVEPNGVLVIRGQKAVKINNEVEFLTLMGRVDPHAIGPDNSITSDQIADARIELAGVGVVADKQRPGWLARVLDLVTPF